MQFRLRFTTEARNQFHKLESKKDSNALLKQVKKTLGYLELNPRHPSLKTHEFISLKGHQGEKIFEAYAQNNTPGAYRIFWHYGPDEFEDKKRISVITIVTITPHP